VTRQTRRRGMSGPPRARPPIANQTQSGPRRLPQSKRRSSAGIDPAPAVTNRAPSPSSSLSGRYRPPIISSRQRLQTRFVGALIQREVESSTGPP